MSERAATKEVAAERVVMVVNRALHMQSHGPEQSQPGRAAAEKILTITASIA